MTKHQPETDALRRAIEDALGKKIKTPKDFQCLIAAIENKTNELLCISTVKRFWNYVSGSEKPRISTLDILCQYIGYETWEDFLQHLEKTKNIVSDFISQKQISTLDLTSGALLDIGWKPNRSLLLEYLGNSQFKVNEVRNSKLKEGDTFFCNQFLLHHPLYADHVHRDGKPLGAFIGGKEGGLCCLQML